MYVCLCMGITDREIEETIRDGAGTVDEVMRCSKAGTRCGSCRPSIAALLGRSEQAPASRRRSLEILRTSAA